MFTAALTTNYEQVLRETWAGDTTLLALYHACAPCDLDAAVTASAAVLRGPSVARDFEFRALYYGEKVAGFIGVEPAGNCLVTFGLHVDFRLPAAKEAFWAEVRNFTAANRPVTCVLHAHNYRARRFLRAAGAVATGRVAKGVVYSFQHT